MVNPLLRLEFRIIICELGFDKWFAGCCQRQQNKDARLQVSHSSVDDKVRLQVSLSCIYFYQLVNTIAAQFHLVHYGFFMRQPFCPTFSYKVFG